MKIFDKIIDYIAKKINIAYGYNKNSCISFIVTDDIELKKRIQKQILCINTSTIIDKNIIHYDFFENRKNQLKLYSQLCKEKGNLILATGLERYAEYLKQIGKIKNNGDFYMNVFNIPRDSFYLSNNVRMILLLNQKEYSRFLDEYGDDFLSYAHIKEDLDSILRRNENLQNKQTVER